MIRFQKLNIKSHKCKCGDWAEGEVFIETRDFGKPVKIYSEKYCKFCGSLEADRLSTKAKEYLA